MTEADDARVLARDERELARHALGLPNKRKKTYRNHFVAGEGGLDHAIWMRMVETGHAKRWPGSPLTGGDDLFRLTRKGAEAALNQPERLCPEDFPAAHLARAQEDGERE